MARSAQRPRLRWLPCLAMLCALCGVPATAGGLLVAAAANFAAPVQALARAFEEDSGHQVRIATGSTGALYAQIRNGAPFDVLLSADTATPERLVREGRAVDGSRVTYATGRLVLWSRDPARVDSRGDVLRSAASDRLAVANPGVAPYGAAAMEVLKHLGVAERVAGRIVQAENVAQAWQFVASGNAGMGFVALSQVQSGGKITNGSAWVVPAELHAPLRQDAVLLIRAGADPAARAWMAWLRGDRARAIIRASGYEA